MNKLIGQIIDNKYVITSIKKKFNKIENKNIYIIQAELANNIPKKQKEIIKVSELINQQFYMYTIIDAEYKRVRKKLSIYVKVKDSDNNIKEYRYAQFLQLIQRMDKNLNKIKLLINTKINNLIIIDCYYKLSDSKPILYVTVKDMNNNTREYPYTELKNIKLEKNKSKSLQKLINTEINDLIIIDAQYKKDKFNKRKLLYVTTKDKDNNIKEYKYSILLRMNTLRKRAQQLIGVIMDKYKIVDAQYKFNSYNQRVLYVTVQDENNDIYEYNYQYFKKYVIGRIKKSKRNPSQTYQNTIIKKHQNLINTKIGIYTIIGFHYQQLQDDKKPRLYIQLQDNNNVVKEYKYTQFNKEVKPKIERINSLINKNINGYIIVSAFYKDEGKRIDILYVQLQDENKRLYECRYGLLNKFIGELQHCKKVIGKVAGRYTIIDAKYDQRDEDARRAIYVTVKDNNNGNISEYKYYTLMKKTKDKNKRLQNLIGKKYSKYTIIDATYAPAGENKNEVIYVTVRDDKNNILEMKYSELKSYQHQEQKLNSTGHVTKARAKYLIGKIIDDYKILSIRYEFNEQFKQDVLFVTVQDKNNNIQELKYRNFQDLIKRNRKLSQVINQVIGQYTILSARYKQIKDNKYILWVQIKDQDNIEYNVPYNNLLIINNKKDNLNKLINQIINDYTIIKAEYKFSITCVKPFINVTIQDKNNNTYQCDYKYINIFTKSKNIMEKMNSLIGIKFDKLTVISTKYEKRGNRTSRIYCTCKCECGEVKEYEYSLLSNHIVHSCGCGKYMDLNTLIGLKFGKYTIISAERKKKSCDRQNNIYVQVNDKNGNIKEYKYNYLRTKYTTEGGISV